MTIKAIEILSLREPEADVRDWWSTTPLDILRNPDEHRLDSRQPGAEQRGAITNVVVVVHDDQQRFGLGTVGLGSPAAADVIEHHLAPLVLGTSVFDLERTWKTMFRNTLAIGRKGLVIEAISAIDIALWDLFAKTLQQPVYNLLGGLAQPKIRAYASQLYARKDLNILHEEAATYAAAGFSTVKMRFGYGPADGRRGMRANHDLLRTVREAVGDDVDIAGEAYMGWDVPYAIRMINAVEEFDLAWVEEPVAPDALDSYAYIRSRTGTPISGGEHEFTLAGFQQMLRSNAVDILQPDVNRMGGITEARKVWALAEAYDTAVIPHSNQAHNAHLIASSFNSPLIEVFPEDGVRTGYNFYHQFFRGEPRAVDGSVALGSAHGLGLSLVPGVVSAHLAQRRCIGVTEVDVLDVSSTAAVFSETVATTP